MYEDSSIIQALEDRAYLFQGLRGLLSDSDPEALHLLAGILRWKNQTSHTLSEAAALAIRGNEEELDDELASPEAWAFLRVVHAATDADIKRLDAACAILRNEPATTGSEAVTDKEEHAKPQPKSPTSPAAPRVDTVSQTDLETIYLLSNSGQTDKLHDLCRSILDRFVAGADLEFGVHRAQAVVVGGRRSLVVDGREFYTDPGPRLQLV